MALRPWLVASMLGKEPSDTRTSPFAGRFADSRTDSVTTGKPSKGAK